MSHHAEANIKANTGDHVPPIGSPPPRPQFTLSQLMLWTALIGVVLGSWRLATSLDPIAAGVATSCCLLGLAIAWYVAAPAGRMWAVLSAGAALPVLLGWLAAESAFSGRTPSKRLMCCNNLKVIAQSLVEYHARHGKLPPAYITDKQGRPMHGWRVLVLPYLDQQLYDQYRFDEPWNGPNNSKLAGRVQNPFRCPSDDEDGPQGSEHDTSYVVVVGPRTAFPGDKCVALSNITDDQGNTILVVEVANSGIHWMEPRDLHVTQMARTINPAKGQGISSEHNGGANVVMADGSAQFLSSENLTAEDVESLLTIDGNEPPRSPQPED